MIRQTGGFADGATSTRSSSRCCAIDSACSGGITPTCPPSSSTTRPSFARIISLTRTRTGFIISLLLRAGPSWTHGPIRDEFLNALGESFELLSPEISFEAIADGDLPRFDLLVPNYKHERDFVGLGRPN